MYNLNNSFDNCRLYVDGDYIGNAEIKEIKLEDNSAIPEIKNNFNRAIRGSITFYDKGIESFIKTHISKLVKHKKRERNRQLLYEKRKRLGRKL